MKASANIKKEVDENTPMVAFSEEFVKFMNKPELEKKPKQANIGSRKLKCKDPQNIEPSATPREKKSTEATEQKPHKTNKTLKEIKNDMESLFKSVDITDKKGNLVNSAKKPQVAKKDSPKSKLKTTPNAERDVKKNTMTRKLVERKSTLEGNYTKEKHEKKFRNKSTVADMYKMSQAKKKTMLRKHVEQKNNSASK